MVGEINIAKLSSLVFLFLVQKYLTPTVQRRGLFWYTVSGAVNGYLAPRKNMNLVYL